MTSNNPIYLALLPLLIFNVAFMTLFMYYAVTFQFRKKDPEALARLHKSFLGAFFHNFWYWLIDPIVKLLAFLRFTPNTVTALSVLLSIYTGYIFAIGKLNWTGWLIIISGSFDLLDGRLARLTDRSTQSGAFFDSCMDRYNDAFVYIGLGLYFIGKNFKMGGGGFTVSPLDFAMLIVSILLVLGTEVMSYAKARGEAMGFSTKRGLMQRPERVAFLGAVMVLFPFFRIIAIRNGYHPEIALIAGLLLMTVLVNYSAIVRIVDLFRTIKKLETGEEKA